jgi:hypothetical protein
VASELVAVTERLDRRTSMVRVLRRDVAAHEQVERCILGTAGDGVESVVVDVSRIRGGVDYALLLGLMRAGRRLGHRGVRTALVCCAADARVLEAGNLDRRFLLATSPREAMERLRDDDRQLAVR